MKEKGEETGRGKDGGGVGVDGETANTATEDMLTKMETDTMAAARNDDEEAVDTRYEVVKEDDTMAAARDDDEEATAEENDGQTEHLGG